MRTATKTKRTIDGRHDRVFDPDVSALRSIILQHSTRAKVFSVLTINLPIAFLLLIFTSLLNNTFSTKSG